MGEEATAATSNTLMKAATKILAAGILTAGLCGCVESETLWTASATFPDARWEPSFRVSFQPDSASMAKGTPSMMLATLRYAADASVESFPMVVEQESPENGYRCDTITFHLLPALDRRGANARMGVFETTDTLPMGRSLGEGWEVTLYPASGAIDGLYSLTVTLKK